MAEFKLNISLNSELDVERLAEDIRAAFSKELERVGVKAEVAGEYRKVTDRGPKAGDFVKVKENSDLYEDISYGKYYEVFADEDGDSIFVDDVEDERLLRVYRINRDYEVFEKVAQPEPLKVGDYVKALSNSAFGNINKGEIGILEEIDYDNDYVVVPLKNSKTNGLFKVEQLAKATDEEVAKAKRPQAWAKIGRKPNEFKKGDIVRITRYQYGAQNGVLVEVESVFSEGQGLSYTGGYCADFTAIELITPVEARFDHL